MAEELIRESHSEHLDELVLGSADVEDFLFELAVAAAGDLSLPGQDVSASVTLVRRKKATTAASSDDRARSMDEVQYKFHAGPCLTAIREGVTVHVRDLRTEERWPEYCAAVDHGVLRSVLGVPFLAEGGSKAALNIYSAQEDAFSAEEICKAEKYALDAGTSLRLALRIAQLTDARNDLTAAMSSRTVIDLAAGAIMGQNHCSQEAAMAILKSASSTRNIKLHDVAAAVVASLSKDATVSTHFDP